MALLPSRKVPSTVRLHGRSGGLAAWSILHPIGVVMITLAVMVLGAFAFARLQVNLLPDIIYPEVRVRVLDSGVATEAMEDRVTRQLEEQLAITEDAIAVQSRTGEGSSSVDLSFPYGKDIDIALRDASTRLDRARRFLPETVDPPIIYKFDPSQLPVQEYVISSPLRDAVELRQWVDYVFAKWFLNLPGVAAAEVGGGLLREIQVLPDQQRLAGLGLSVEDLIDAIEAANRDEPAGRLRMESREVSGRTAGRIQRVEELAELPLALADGETIPLAEVAQVLDTHEEERLRVRLNGLPGIKLSLQKQPTANTVAVAEAVAGRLDWLHQQKLIPEDIEVTKVSDQAVYVRNALRNAGLAAASGALLAMGVVYLFLGSLRRTLIIGSAIPVAALVTFAIMDMQGLTLNIMTLGGLAVGIGMLVDSTIVMLENIHRHQRDGEAGGDAGRNAAAEVNSAIVASTSTNLAAILPFLFVGGLVGLLFREMIITITAAIAASMVVALTLVPSLAARVPAGKPSLVRRAGDWLMGALQRGYGAVVGWITGGWFRRLTVIGLFTAGLVHTVPEFLGGKELFLPKMDDGRVYVSISADPGVTLAVMDEGARRLEALFLEQPEVETVFASVGGFIFGRTQRMVSNRSSFYVQLKPLDQRDIGGEAWVKRMMGTVKKARIAGLKVYMRLRGVRGIRTGRGEDDVSIRIAGPRIATLEQLATEVEGRLEGVAGVRNVENSSGEKRQELAIEVDRKRAATLGLDVGRVGNALRVALEGRIVGEFLAGDRAFDIRVRLPRGETDSPNDLAAVLLFPAATDRPAIHLGDVATVRMTVAPATILRDNQQRVVEVSASLKGDASIAEVSRGVEAALIDLELPAGYALYEVGEKKALQEGRDLTQWLLGLALFLVLVVMAVQYESLRAPLVILLGVPFAAIGVALGVPAAGLPLSMPVWLGVIMLAGIVVNNAIILVEYIELLRADGVALADAVRRAAALRLRPILMTTLTTVVGLLPLALGLGEGAEMLQPLAVTITSGLTFSLLVSLLLIPVLYRSFARR